MSVYDVEISTGCEARVNHEQKKTQTRGKGQGGTVHGRPGIGLAPPRALYGVRLLHGSSGRGRVVRCHVATGYGGEHFVEPRVICSHYVLKPEVFADTHSVTLADLRLTDVDRLPEIGDKRHVLAFERRMLLPRFQESLHGLLRGRPEGLDKLVFEFELRYPDAWSLCRLPRGFDRPHGSAGKRRLAINNWISRHR